MSKAVEVLLGEKTRIVISVSTLLLVLVSTITFVWSVSAMKTEIDLSINSLEKSDIRIEQKFDNSIYDLECADEDIIIEQKEQSTLLSEVQSSQSDIKASLARIETHNVWIIDVLKEYNK